MVRECFKAKTGIMFIASGLQNLGIDTTTLETHPHPHPRSGIMDIGTYPNTASQGQKKGEDGIMSVSEEEHELLDATSPIYDRLSSCPLWWLLELVPVPRRRQREDNTWEETERINFGRGREFNVPLIDIGEGSGGQFGGVVKVHRSVRLRMDMSGGEYVPRAGLQKMMDAGRVVWVD
jgi:hypothetical protein